MNSYALGRLIVDVRKNLAYGTILVVGCVLSWLAAECGAEPAWADEGTGVAAQVAP